MNTSYPTGTGPTGPIAPTGPTGPTGPSPFLSFPSSKVELYWKINKILWQKYCSINNKLSNAVIPLYFEGIIFRDNVKCLLCNSKVFSNGEYNTITDNYIGIVFDRVINHGLEHIKEYKLISFI